jgi:hypothetical protein
MSEFQHKLFRENIVTLKQNNPYAFGKFIMALKNLEESDDWARICGIHGNTFRPNDPAVLCPTDPTVVAKLAKTGEPFYCAHSIEPFIAWHVPYIFEFESLLNKYDKTFDKNYITLPYFDITDQTENYAFLNNPTIRILYKNEYIYVRNPLASAYYYPNGIKTQIERNGYVQATTAIQHKKLHTIRRQLYNTLHAKTYEEFSSQIVSTIKTYKPYGYVPLETPHNSIHDIIGGNNGNMSDISISAFDPVFWLHHCNMDRFFYNWLKNIGEKNYEKVFSQNSLQSTLAPFSKLYRFGWQNNTTDFLFLKDVISIQKYPYSYHHIVLHAQPTKSACINLIDIPIPIESITINAYIHPKSERLTQYNKNNWFAGSVSWFGINRTSLYCERCERVRTNLTIDILDFVLQYSISNDNIDKYDLFIEANGKLIKNTEGRYITYSIEEIIQDGSISIDV